MRRQLALVLLFWSISYSVAPAQTTVLRADSFLDVTTGELVSPATIVIEDGLISAINPDEVPMVDETRIVETIALDGMTLAPGLMDMHTHLGGDLEGDWQHKGVTHTTADVALRGARNARRTLEAGFTTVRDVGSSGFADISLMKAIDRGDVPGPSIFPAGHSLGITGGHCDATGYRPGIAERGPESGIADGVDEVLKAVRYQIKHGAKVIKICATAGVLSHEEQVGAQQFSDAEMAAVVEEAARHSLRVAAHAHGTEGIIAASRAGVASIDHGSILTSEAINIMIENGTWLVPTAYLTRAIDLDILPDLIRAKAEYVIVRMRESLRAAIAADVKIALGTDAGVYPHGDNANELEVYVDAGMSSIDAIRTATTNAAELLGVHDRGRIEVGLRADIIAVLGNPLDDITAFKDVGFVMKEGVRYK